MWVIFEGGGLNGKVIDVLNGLDRIDARDGEKTVEMDESVGDEGKGESVLVGLVAAPSELEVGDDTCAKMGAVLVHEGCELGGAELGRGSHSEGVVVLKLVMTRRR